MKTLVTGGAGFIGSHLVDLLLEQGHDVTVLDNLCNGNLNNLEQCKDNPNFHFHICDITNFEEIKEYFKNIDWVFHLAALADIVPSIDRPMDYHNTNVNGTINILEASKLCGVKKIIYAASSSCYGIAEELPTSETAAIMPQYPYALTKNIAEQYVMHWSKIYKIPAVSLRMFNVYGPRSRTSGTYGAVFGVFLAQKLANIPFTVVGDGKQTRDFTYVGDVVKAYLMVAQSETINCDIFNIGSGNTYSINELCSLLGGEITYIPKRPGEPDCTFADTKKINTYLGWQAQTTFQDGVKIMLENIDYWRNAPVWDKDSIAVATEEWFKYLLNNKD